MATKKTTTRGKTKTQATKTTKATTTKRTAPHKTATKSTQTTKAAAAATTRRRLLRATLRLRRATNPAAPTIDGLRRSQAVSAAVFIALAIAAGLLMRPVTYSLTLGHMGRDSLASRTETIYAPAKEPIFDLEVRWLLVVLMGVAAIFSLLYLTVLKTQYQDSLKAGVSKWRWIEMAVTTALMVGLVAVLSGVDEIMTLLLVGSLMVGSAAMGWLAEREAVAIRSSKVALVTSTVAGVLPLAFFAVYAVATNVYGGIRYGWYVYALYAVLLLGGFLVYRTLQNNSKADDYAVTDRRYSVLSLLAKGAFALILIIGLRH